MSKLIERIKKLGQSEETVVGFGSSRQQTRQPTVLLIGQTSASSIGSVGDTQVDAIVVKGLAEEMDSVGSALDGKVWGVRTEILDVDHATSLKKQGADFVVFNADSTDAAVLDIDDLGAVLIVNGAIEDEQARGLRSLSIDLALYVPNEELNELSITRLGQIQTAGSAIGKPIIVAVSDGISPKQVETLRNADVVGLLVDLSSTDRTAELRETIDNLPRKKRRSEEANSPMVPLGGGSSKTEPDESDEDDFDEGDY
jgi:hypothetical protein